MLRASDIEWTVCHSVREGAYRGAIHKVVDIMKGHGEGCEGQHHALFHIALLEAVAPHLVAGAGTPQLVCTNIMKIIRSQR